LIGTFWAAPSYKALVIPLNLPYRKGVGNVMVLGKPTHFFKNVWQGMFILRCTMANAQFLITEDVAYVLPRCCAVFIWGASTPAK
jgi:hypothetical protein